MTKLRASVTFQIFYAGCEARNRRRLKRINANKFHMKSGGVGHPSFAGGRRLSFHITGGC
jgi:hypothetical protein